MSTEMIPLSEFREHPLHDNVCTPEIYEKIKARIQESGNIEPVIGYRDPAAPNHITLINGHIRWQIAQELGLMHLECAVWTLTPEEAEVTLATLNTLRGTPDRYKRAVLVESLTKRFSADELSRLLPESKGDIQDLLALRMLNREQQEKAFAEQIHKEKKELPQILTFMVTPSAKVTIEEALALVEASDRATALLTICEKYLEFNRDEQPAEA